MKEFTITAVSSDGIGFIKRHPEVFLQQHRGIYGDLGSELAAKIVGGALLLTDKPVTAVRRSGWWIIYSEEDWLIDRAEIATEEAFSRPAPFPEAGQNAIRPEALLFAFASVVVTMRGSEITVVKGALTDLDKPVFEAEPRSAGRLIAFRL